MKEEKFFDKNRTLSSFSDGELEMYIRQLTDEKNRREQAYRNKLITDFKQMLITLYKNNIEVYVETVCENCGEEESWMVDPDNIYFS